MKVKLGQKIEFKKENVIHVAKGGTVIVHSGDTARVVRKVDKNTAEIVYLTGEAKGLSQNVLLEVDAELDTDAIAKKILNELNN